MWGPGGLPAEVVRTMNAAVQKVAAMPDVREKLVASGLRPLGGSPDDLARIMKTDHEVWGQVIREANIRIE
jgi:tripartite-type tricarboxylate transporter receptor subunit TctC